MKKSMKDDFEMYFLFFCQIRHDIFGKICEHSDSLSEAMSKVKIHKDRYFSRREIETSDRIIMFHKKYSKLISERKPNIRRRRKLAKMCDYD